MASPSISRIEHLRLRDLLLIERIHEFGSLRQVAESMHLTQPAVTQALQTLEEAFGAQLVTRTSGGASLTSTGLAVLHRLKAMRWEAVAAHAAAHEPQHPTITLGISSVTTMQVTPKVLIGFAQMHPSARLHLRESNSPALWQQLTQGKLDAILCRMPRAEEIEKFADLVTYDVLGTQRMMLIAAAHHPLVAQIDEHGFSKAQLAHQGWVLPPPDSQARYTLDEWFLRADIAAPVAVITSESFYTNIRLVAASTLLTVVPDSTLAELSSAYKLAVLPVDTDWEGFTYFFACRTSSLVNPLISALRDHFVRAR